jgi:hypothetical protein
LWALNQQMFTSPVQLYWKNDESTHRSRQCRYESFQSLFRFRSLVFLREKTSPFQSTHYFIGANWCSIYSSLKA